MTDSGWLRLTLAVLATWRLSRLVAFEDGPWDVVARARRLAGDGMLGHLMDCPYCLSLWFAAPLALAIDATLPGWVLAWLGVSGGASLVEKIVSRGEPPDTVAAASAQRAVPAENPDGAPSVPLAPHPGDQERSDGLLWEPARRSAPGHDHLHPHDRPLGAPEDD
jgi:hypothetical protein